MQDNAGEVIPNPKTPFSNGPLHTGMLMLDVQLQQLCTDTRCSQEDLQEAIDDRDE